MQNIKSNLLTGCHLSWMSYYPVYKPTNNKIHKVIPLHIDGDAYGMYIKKRSCSYVAFRGSKNMNELMKAITAFPMKIKEGSVHSGFWDRYMQIKEQVHNIICNDVAQDMFFVGHSMGGCLALFTAYDVSNYNKDSNLHCYMYGSPVTADNKYLNHVESNLEQLLSLEIKNDLIPKLPLNPQFSKPKVLELENHIQTHNFLECHSCASYYRSIKKTTL